MDKNVILLTLQGPKGYKLSAGIYDASLNAILTLLEEDWDWDGVVVIIQDG